MGEAEDTLRARKWQATEHKAGDQLRADQKEAERLRLLADQTRALVTQALAELQRTGFPGGILLEVETLDRKTGIGKNRRFESHETAAWEIYDGSYTGIDGGRFTSPVYLASNGQFVITHGFPRNRLSHAGHYYLRPDTLSPYSSTPDAEIRWLEHVIEGLRRLAGRNA